MVMKSAHMIMSMLLIIHPAQAVQIAGALAMTDSSTNKRVVYFSHLKSIACLAVVILHTFYAADAFAISNSQHMLALVLRNLMMWAVPCFVMVTGALLLDSKREVPLKKIFCKYLPRVVVALVLFSIAFAIFDAFLLSKPIGEALITGLKAIVLGTGWRHMWYLYLMIGIYLLLPMFRMVVRSAGSGEIRYLLGVLFIFQAIIPMVQIIFNIEVPFYICIFSIYPLFLLAGYAIHNEIIVINKWVSIALVLFGVLSLTMLTYLGVYRDSSIANSLVGLYSFPGTVFMSVGVFSLAKSCYTRSSMDAIMIMIDKNSFGIYLLHMAVLKFFAVKVRPAIFDNPVWMIAEVIAAFVIPFVLVSIYCFVRKGLRLCKR